MLELQQVVMEGFGFQLSTTRFEVSKLRFAGADPLGGASEGGVHLLGEESLGRMCSGQEGVKDCAELLVNGVNVSVGSRGLPVEFEDLDFACDAFRDGHDGLEEGVEIHRSFMADAVEELSGHKCLIRTIMSNITHSVPNPPFGPIPQPYDILPVPPQHHPAHRHQERQHAPAHPADHANDR